MEQNKRQRQLDNTDWIQARKAADPEKTEIPDPSGTIKANFYTTGWLVCVNGPEKGRDWRLKAGFNRIGRYYDHEVCVFEDPAVSRDEHCSVVYDEKSNSFFLVPGMGTATYIGKDVLTGPELLHTGDRFQIGDTTMEFIAYCRENIKW